MTADEDLDNEEALAWAGDEKPKVRVEPVETVPAVEPSPSAPASIPAPLLITYGILAGVYLLSTAGWIVSITRSTTTLPNLLGEIMFQLGEFLAIASPALWFAATLLLTRGRKPIVRLLVLLLGLVATVPWPFLLGV